MDMVGVMASRPQAHAPRAAESESAGIARAERIAPRPKLRQVALHRGGNAREEGADQRPCNLSLR